MQLGSVAEGKDDRSDPFFLRKCPPCTRSFLCPNARRAGGRNVPEKIGLLASSLLMRSIVLTCPGLFGSLWKKAQSGWSGSTSSFTSRLRRSGGEGFGVGRRGSRDGGRSWPEGE